MLSVFSMVGGVCLLPSLPSFESMLTHVTGRAPDTFLFDVSRITLI